MKAMYNQNTSQCFQYGELKFCMARELHFARNMQSSETFQSKLRCNVLSDVTNEIMFKNFVAGVFDLAVFHEITSNNLKKSRVFKLLKLLQNQLKNYFHN